MSGLRRRCRCRLGLAAVSIVLPLVAVPLSSGATGVPSHYNPLVAAAAKIESAITKEEFAIEVLDRTPPQYFQALRRLREAEQLVREAEKDSYGFSPAAVADLQDVERLDLAAGASKRLLDPQLWSKAQIEKAIQKFDADIEKAIALKKKALLIDVALLPEGGDKPLLQPISAVFTQSLFHTVYTEHVTRGQPFKVSWSVSIPLDPRCATGFQGNEPIQDEATWFHADVTNIPPGPCVHHGKDYGAEGHPGVITVVVTNDIWRCEARYYGTLTGTGVPPDACTLL